MHGDEIGVATARWQLGARVGSIAEVRRDVTAFARRHGMAAASRQDLAVAVSEAVAVAVGSLGGAPAPGAIVVDAATDGEWLSVRVRGAERAGHDGDPAVVLPLMTALAARVEWDPGRGDEGGTSLMEFAMTASPRDDRGSLRRDAHGRRRRAAPLPLRRRTRGAG